MGQLASFHQCRRREVPERMVAVLAVGLSRVEMGPQGDVTLFRVGKE